MGFLLTFLTWLDGHKMAVVPSKEDNWKGVFVKTGENSFQPREGVVFREGEEPKEKDKNQSFAEVNKPHLFISQSSTYGVLFATVLLLVIVITNVPLRGLWSFVIIMFLVMLSIIFAFAGWWDSILRTISALAIHINMGGYLFISSVLFIIWLLTFLLFDQQLYMIFTPGQLKVRLEIGGGEKAYDTMGMTIEKQRSDLFRHWVLGLGSGDLIVNTGGSHLQHFDLPNVLFIGRKVKEIEDMLRERAVVKGHA
jgi:hypothetical protein